MDFITKIKETRKNLHYVSAVSRTKPVDKIPVDSSKMAKLDLWIYVKFLDTIFRTIHVVFKFIPIPPSI